jgi:hypothetical protein
VETRGEVVWSTFSGQCGIRFLGLSPRMVRQIDEWILGDLLSGLSVSWPGSESAVAASASASSAWPTGAVPTASSTHSPSTVADQLGGATGVLAEAEEEDGLTVSPMSVNVIELPVETEPAVTRDASSDASILIPVELDWLSRPLSGRGLIWTVNTLVVIAALLLFALVFLSVTREAPKWPVTMAAAAALVVAGLYWGFFKTFGGSSFGARLARLAGAELEDDREDDGARFR